MNTFKNRIFPIIGGMVYMLGILLLSRLFLKHLGSLVGWLCTTAGLKEQLVSHICLALAQLKQAALTSPWLAGLLIGAVSGWLIHCIPKRTVRIRITIAICVLMLLPLVLLAACFTEVNSIRFLNLLNSLFSLLPALL